MTKRKIRSQFAERIQPHSNFYLLLIILLSVPTVCLTFCHPGCHCADESRSVECENISSIPILFHPMLRSLTVKNSPSLRLDAVSIGLYQELEHLDLSQNEIREIPVAVFNELKKLRVLNLSANKLTIFDPHSFSLLHRHHVSKIQKLDLSKNEIERIVSIAYSSKHELLIESNLLSLNLSENRLHHLYDPTLGETFSGWAQNLRHLDLSKNRIAHLDAKLFNRFQKLEHLNLAANLLTEINDSVFSHLTSLIELNLAKNLISTIGASAFIGLKKMRELSLANCMISNLINIRHNWRHVPQLRHLILSGNNIVEIGSATFDGLYTLENLELSDLHQLKILKDRAFGGLVSLKSLILRNCPLLNTLPSSLFGDYDGALPSSGLPPTHLAVLDLSENALNTVNAGILNDGWSQLTLLNLSGNRWHCDCELLDFMPRALRSARLHANANGSKVEKDSLAYCTTPEALFNLNIEEIKDTSHCNLTNSRTSAPIFALLTVATMVFGALSTLMALTALICCCCWRYHYASRQKSRASDCDAYQTNQHQHSVRRNIFRLFMFPLKKAKNSTNPTRTSIKGIVTGTATGSTASTSSSSASSASSSSSSYFKRLPSRDVCAPLCSFNAKEHLYYDKASESDEKSRKNFISNSSNNSNEYYASIPTCGMDIFTTDYCLPPPADYCTHRPVTVNSRQFSNSNSQVLISYGTDTIAYPPYLYHSKSNYYGTDVVGAHHNHHYAYGSNEIDSIYDIQNDSCCYGSHTSPSTMGVCTLARQAPMPTFIAPPPPSTIPPPPCSAPPSHRAQNSGISNNSDIEIIKAL